MTFLASFLCVDCICLVKGFLAQAAIGSFFRAELRWRHKKKGCSTDAVQCRLYSGQGKVGKNKRHELIAFAACSKGECLKVVWINLEISPVHRFSYRLVFTLASFLKKFLASFLVHCVLQSYVLCLVRPLEGSPVHLSLFILSW